MKTIRLLYPDHVSGGLETYYFGANLLQHILPPNPDQPTIKVDILPPDGKEKQITLLEGDAQKVLKTLEEPFDFIFMDAAKGQYIHFLPDILRLLVKGGILISDNVLQDGDIIQSHFAVERRNRTIYKRMREYLSTLKNSSELETAILPLGDGVALSVRK